MHNNIMAAISRDRPPMLVTGRYPQWRSRFLRYIDTRPNGEALRKCILSGPYKPTTVLVQAVAATDDSSAIPKHTIVETPINMSPADKAHFEAEKEAIHMILTGIRDEIYSTVDAFQTAQEMWEDIERLQQADKAHFEAEKEAIHMILTGIRDEIYSTVDAFQTAQEMWEDIERLQQEWSRFVMIVKQQHKLDEVSYHKLFDILKQYKKEVNELHAKRLARNANPLALVATAQANKDPYYQTSKSHKSYAPSLKPLIPTKTHTTTIHKGKEIAKPITTPSETTFKEDSDPEQAQRDKDMQKNLAFIAKYFKKSTNLPTTTSELPQTQGTRISLGFSVLTARNLVILPRNAESLKGLKTLYTDEENNEQELEAHYCYMAKIQEVPIADSGTDSEPLEQVQNDAGYNVFANELQDSEQSESISNTCLVETDDSNVIPDSPDMCEDDIQNDQNDVESDDERVEIANIIANLKLNVDENKKIQKQLKKANITLAQELKEYKTILAETGKTLGESISIRDSCLVALQTKQTKFEKYKAFNDRTVDYDKLKRKLNETLGQLALKDIEIKEGLKTKAYEISVVKEKHDELIKQSLLTKSHYEGLVKQKTKVIIDLKLREEHDIDKMLSMEKQLNFLNEIVYKRRQSIQTIHMMAPKVSTYKGVNHKTNVSRPHHRSNQLKDKVVPNNSQVKLKKTQVEGHPRIPSVSNKMKSITACKDNLNSRTLNANAVCTTCNKCLVDSNHFASVTKMLNDLNARTKKPNIVQLILFIVDSGCTKHMTGNLKLLCNFVEKFLGTVHFGNDQFAPFLGYGDLVQGNVTINRVYYVEGLNHNLFSVDQFCDADLEVAFWKSTCFVKDLQGNDLLTSNCGSDLYTIPLQELTSSTPLCLMAKASPTQAWLWHQRLSHLNFDYNNLLSKKDVVIGLLKLKYIKDQLCSSYELSKEKRSTFKSKAVPISKGRLNLLHMDLCGPMRVASINRKKYILVIVDDYSRYT
uniref:Retrovirus-related Pol polyprotein from transposon TNT 1-94 n=1 Tax=Tanacetum cinerariifolium TaxID=118510 RepID=A0A6L2LD80_TANCI|nr:retrovirus-related Pol polyprotein from transposon TNT 1-94 [Tanacetum cinerariifolium]